MSNVQGESKNPKIEILIVEDSPTQAEHLRNILEQNAYRVLIARHGREALTLLSRHRPTLVISDILMPEMDGYELCRRIKADENLKDIPVILLTTLSDPTDVLRALECGASNFITKPYDKKYLLSRIHYILANMELRKSTVVQMGMNVFFANHTYFINAERLQILDLLLSTYETAVQENLELIKTRDELKALNEHLEDKVAERTAALTTEILERARMEEKLRQQNEYLTALHETTLALMNRLDLTDLLEAITVRAAALMGTPHGYIYLVEPEGTEMTEKVGIGAFSKFIGYQLKYGEGLAGKVWQTGQPLKVEDYRTWSGQVLNPEFRIFRALVGVPLKSGQQVMGVIGLARIEEGQRFEEEEVELLSRFAELASIALDNARLYTAAQQELAERKRAEEALATHAQQQAVVATLGQLALAGTDLQQLFDQTVTMVATTLRTEYCKVLELLSDGNALKLVSGVGWKEELVGHITIGKNHNSQAGFTLLRKEPLIIEDLRAETRFSDSLLQDHGIISGVSVIIGNLEEPFGVLSTHTTRRRTFSQDDVHFFQSVANVLAEAIQRKRAEKALKEAHIQLNHLLNVSPTVIYSLRITSVGATQALPILCHPLGALSFVSENVKTLLGYKVTECLTNPDWWIDHLHPEDRSQVLSQQPILFDQDTLDYEYRFQHKDGTYRWIYDKMKLLRDPTGKPLEIVGSWMDITPRKQAEETIRHLAYYDALTDLPNRLLFNDRLTLALAHAHRNQQQLAVMLIDLDRFKVINDTLGHAIGDRLLQGVAQRLTGCLREGDTVARLGGDEFMLLLPGVEHTKGTIKIVQKILEAFKPSFNFNNQELHITPSIGIALYPDDGEDAQTLLKNADTALHRAKEQGRNNYQFYTSTMNATALERLNLESKLRYALERKEFVVYYQPQVSLKTGQIVGIEALVRWQHPDLGLIPPLKFIPLAEETGLSVPLGLWVLRTACAQNKAWQEAGYPPLKVAVNLSTRLFKQQNLIQQVAQVLQETGFDPDYLELELTEGIIMENIETAITTLKELKKMGVHLAVDDFGTGYSSLAYLKQFPIDTLKIDRSFVLDITTDPDDAMIALLIINMAHNLKLKVIAEGVETKEQLTFLRSYNCDEIQGYLFSRPVPAEELVKLLQERKTLTD